MGTKYPSPRRIKIHRSYTIEEIAGVLHIHKHTVRRWEKAGLAAIDGGRPKLFLGTEIRRFLRERRRQARRPSPPGHMFCFRCRAPKIPSGGFVDLLPLTSRVANLCGMCDCGTLMYRRVSHRTIAVVIRDLAVTIPDAQSRLTGGASASLNVDFIALWKSYDKIQRGQ
jgi:hypothetical protein